MLIFDFLIRAESQICYYKKFQIVSKKTEAQLFYKLKKRICTNTNYRFRKILCTYVPTVDQYFLRLIIAIFAEDENIFLYRI